ncbi:stress-response A/B barrel domain-containing protein At5g22580-like [Musa acuminata AAA Group]|uniref:stress-response A/B barrel domain-containing protein At5g22580 n=1 Tax=Musa acuminata AAA Group TaxID=214697 RepID=UPI0031D9C1F9
MGHIKHLVLAKFKDGAAVEELLQGLQNLVSEIDVIKSFEWGEDVLKDERLGQGFTHAFLLSFGSAEDLAAYIKHPSHVEYGKAFRAAIDKVLAIDFPVVAKEISAGRKKYASNI